VELKLSGNFTVIDGCTFSLQNFTFLNSPPLVYWYGMKKGNEATSRRLSEAVVVEQNAVSSVNFTLSSIVGRETSWDDVNWVRLFSESAAQVIAEIDLSGPDVNGLKSDAHALSVQLSAFIAAAVAVIGNLFG
jgi:hypothetical protein